MPVLSTTYRDPNRGSINLNHDLTPRDFMSYKSSTEPSEDLKYFGFRGFPGFGFERSRERAPVAVSIATPLSRWPQYGRPQYFDPRHAKLLGDNGGFNYGSGGVLRGSQEPRALKNPNKGDIAATDIEKFRLQQMDAEKDIQSYKQKQLQGLIEADQRKKHDLAMLQDYNPWGRAGGGAPNNQLTTHHGKAGLQESKLFHGVSSSKHEEAMHEYGDFHTSFGKPGAGAPLLTHSGKPNPLMRSDPAIRFMDTKGGRQVCDTEMRYRKPSEEKEEYRKALEGQVEKKNVSLQEQRLLNLRKELEMLPHDPFGKPGAGAPNKPTPDADVNQHSRAASDQDCYDPWGKGAGQPMRTKQGDVTRHKFSDKTSHAPYTEVSRNMAEGASLSLGQGLGGAGSPLKTGSGQIKTRHQITMRRNDKGDTVVREGKPSTLGLSDPDLAVYDPWGQGGGGAPLVDSAGVKNSSVFGKLRQERRTSADERKRVGAQSYLAELQRGAEERRKQKVEEEHDLRNGPIELATIMQQGRVGHPRRDPTSGMLVNCHLPTSDVTKDKLSSRSYNMGESMAYHTELDRAAESRRRMHILDKVKEKEESKHHQSRMNDFWGRPGCGAPNTEGARKHNLSDLLHSPRREGPHKKDDPTYNPLVRCSVDSTHTNQYELQRPLRREPKKDYSLNTPYAVQADEIF